MKQLFHTLFLCGSLLALASCGTDSLLPAPDADGNIPGEPDARPLITITADMGAGASTRTGHDDTPDAAIKVNWAEGDQFVIYSIDADGNKIGEGSTFTLVAGEAGKASAAFEGTKPVDGVEYLICYPANVTFNNPNYAGDYYASLDMRGQKQTGNNSAAHLSKFDPMRGHLVKESDFSEISFTPDDATHKESGHRATVMRFDLTGIPTDLGVPKRIVLGSNDRFESLAIIGGLLGQGVRSTFTLDLENVIASKQSITAYMALASFKVPAGEVLTITLEGSLKNYTFTSPTFGAEKRYERGMRYVASVGEWTEAVINYDGTASANNDYTGGDGSVASPYLISTVGDLKNLIQETGNGKNYTGKYFKLTQNICIAMASGKSWAPIGTSDTPFKGHFDGGGRTISGEMKGTDDYFGFFGYIADAAITNLHVSAKTSSTKSGGYTGAIAGSATSSTISYCTNAGDVNGETGAGIVGGGTGYTLINCINTGKVTATNAGGGLGSGEKDITIVGCFNTGHIAAASVGGILASTGGCTVLGCFNTGYINGADGTGAIMSTHHGSSLKNCWYVYAKNQPSNLTACSDKDDADLENVGKCDGIEYLNTSDKTDILNNGIAEWNSTAAAGLPICYPFKRSLDGNTSSSTVPPVIDLPASSGSIGNIDDKGTAWQ